MKFTVSHQSSQSKSTIDNPLLLQDLHASFDKDPPSRIRHHVVVSQARLSRGHLSRSTFSKSTLTRSTVRIIHEKAMLIVKKRCQQHKSGGCPGRATSEGASVVVRHQHNHPPAPILV